MPPLSHRDTIILVPIHSTADRVGCLPAMASGMVMVPRVTISALVIDDELGKSNKVQRLLVWARLLRVTPPALQTLQQIGAYCGVSRQAVCKDQAQIVAKHPYLKPGSNGSGDHASTNRSNFTLKD